MCDSPHWPYPCDGPPPPRPCGRPSTRPGLPRGACSAPRCASRGRMRPGYSCSPIPIRSTYSGSWGGRSAVRAQLSAQRLGAALSPSEPEAGPRPGPERRDCPLTDRQPPRPRQLELWLATTRLPPPPNPAVGAPYACLRAECCCMRPKVRSCRGKRDAGLPLTAHRSHPPSTDKR